MKTFDQAKCLQRNRLAALRDAVNPASVRLLRGAPEPATEPASEDQALTLMRTQGTLPEQDGEALALINAMQPAGADPLTAEDVYLHYCEAASSNFVPDRFVFLGTTTLQNIAANAAVGVAFMNSHRTGGMSHPSELPFGRTFSGRYEAYQRPDGSMFERTLIGFYMLKGLKPNGDSGPSTDDLHRLINGGTLFDVSVGIYPGADLCDVCGNDVDASDREGRPLCPHVPGTHRRMTEDQIAAQLARGVTRGCASMTLQEYTMGEVSGVYDGAVPGAGFRKALSLARRGELDRTDLEQARAAYVTLARDGDFTERTQVQSVTLSGPDVAPDALPDEEAILSRIGLLASIPLDTHFSVVRAASESLAQRVRELHGVRAAEGRSLSEARRQSLSALAELWEQVGADVATLPVDAAALHALRAEFARIEARHILAGSGVNS